MCDTYNCNYLPHIIFRFYLINHQLTTDTNAYRIFPDITMNICLVQSVNSILVTSYSFKNTFIELCWSENPLVQRIV